MFCYYCLSIYPSLIHLPIHPSICSPTHQPSIYPASLLWVPFLCRALFKNKILHSLAVLYLISHQFHLHSTECHTAFLLFLKQAKLVPAPGPLHWGPLWLNTLLPDSCMAHPSFHSGFVQMSPRVPHLPLQLVHYRALFFFGPLTYHYLKLWYLLIYHLSPLLNSGSLRITIFSFYHCTLKRAWHTVGV